VRVRLNAVRLAWLAGLMILLGLVGPAGAAEFSAQVKQKISGTDTTGRILVKGQNYRMELRDTQGHEVVIVVDQAAGLTRVLMPAEKKYSELESQGLISLMNDPFQSAIYVHGVAEKKAEGTEVLNGYECDKYTFTMPHGQGFKTVMTLWRAKKLDFPLKIVLHDDKGSFIELSQVQEGPVDVALFEIPPGYAKMEEPKRKPKVDVTQLPSVSTSVSGKAPWARRISAAGEIRVAVNPKESVRIKLDNLIPEESVCRLSAFRQGQPIAIDKPTTYTLKDRMDDRELLLGVQNRAEEVAVKVEKGLVMVWVSARESAFREPKAREYYLLDRMARGFIFSAGHKAVLKIASDSQDQPGSQGRVKILNRSRKETYQEEKFDIKNGETKTWEFPATEEERNLDVDMDQGGAVVSLELVPDPSLIKPPEPRKAKPTQTTKPQKKEPKIVYTKPIQPATSRPARPGETSPPPPQIPKELQAAVLSAINHNDLAALKDLLDRGLDVNAGVYGSPILLKAANLGTPEMVKLLLERGADLNYRLRSGSNALDVAMSNSKHWREVVPILVEAGIEVDARTSLWKVVLKARKGKFLPGAVEIIELLLAKGASVDCSMGKDGTTPLMYFAKQGWPEPLKFFLDRGADLNAKTTGGQTALSLAQEKGHREIVELLKAKGAKD